MIFTGGQIVGLFLEFLKPIISPLISTRRSCLRHTLKFLGPIIEERLENERIHGRDAADGRTAEQPPLVSARPRRGRGTHDPRARAALPDFTTSMAAIHTSSMTLTAALADLTIYPEHIGPIHEEAECVVEEGWTKATLASMHKTDSFLHE
ncbi:hypothetical protein DFH09DRAFT_1318568 [Mycena vulgaris]|nr:hypothetical protein DFH09DRAFT_1318568 [Mycena vulgaris]